MQTSELRPCPCCEGKAKYYDDIMVYGHMVYCTNCGLRVTGYNSKKEAMEAWNNRPDSWHTGTPTEENCFYALQCKGRIHHEPYYGVVVNGKFSAINDDGDLMPLPPDLVAWQKIEPYKEKS